ncbi:MAG: hypothetical protein R2711_13195 [Acidimicrobiales bacterium]
MARREAQARAVAHRYLVDGGLSVHPRSVLRYLVAAMAAEVCWLTDDDVLAAHLLVELAPISHRVAVTRLAASCAGHLVRHHALALAVAGDLDGAADLLELAATTAAADGFGWAEAQSLADRAVVLRRRRPQRRRRRDGLRRAGRPPGRRAGRQLVRPAPARTETAGQPAPGAFKRVSCGVQGAQRILLAWRRPPPRPPPPAPRAPTVAVLALVLGLMIAAVAGLATAALAVGPPDGTLRYTWSIGDRYGLDEDHDGIVDDHDGIADLAGDKAFVQSPTYALTFDTCASPAVTERESLITGYVLTLSGPQAKTVNSSSCKITAPVTKLGTYTAKVEIKVGPVTVDSRTEQITPRDLLLVSVGDSVASGEGNPDTLESGTFWSPKWQNQQCHRTSLAGPAQAALRMERRDPHSAVTFLHLACSGASITKGLLGDYEGQDPSAGKVLKPQLDQLKDLVGDRSVDAMTVSIGANDAEFSAVVKACLVQTACHTNVVPGQKNGKQLFDEKAPLITQNYALLDARLDRMAKQQAGDVKLKGKVFVTQYMDVTKDDDGSYCTGLTQKEKDAGKLPGQTTNVDSLTRTR